MSTFNGARLPLISGIFHNEWDLENFQAAKVTYKKTQSQWH